MSDTKEIIEHVRGCINGVQKVTFGKDTVKSLLNVLEQAEARAEQAEARVKSRNNHIHRLLGEALENERNLDGMKSRWQTAEAENERLTAERDWLADKVGDAYGKPCDKDLNFTSGDCPMGHLWGDDCCLHTDKPTCWAAEAARKAVAGEGEA